MPEIRVHVVDFGRTSFYMRYTDPATGQKVTRSTGKRTRREAERAAAVWESELREGQFKPDGRMPWTTFRVRYCREHVAALKPATYRRVNGVLTMFERTMRPANLTAVTSEMLSSYFARLRSGDVSESKKTQPKGKRSEDTIEKHAEVLRAALRWAVDLGFLRDVPRIRRSGRKRPGKASPMKGRPLTDEEFARMLAAAPAVVGPSHAQAWQRFLRGLMLSGLRLEESLRLSWDDPTHLQVDLSGRRPVFLIQGDSEKAGQTRILPMAPEFAEFLLETSEADRRGPVFVLPKRKRRGGAGFTAAGVLAVGRTVSAIGEKSGVVVDQKTGKFASAHDLRRTFGSRWATRVMPQVLMELMRHADISTTLRYYVGANAQRTADVLWDVHHQERKKSQEGHT